MKTIILILTIFVTSGICFADTVTLTKDQFKNLQPIDKAIKEKYAQYKGFNGPADKLEIYGISGESFMKEVAKMKPADEINSDKETLKNEEVLIAKRARKLAIESLRAEGVTFKQAGE